MNIMGAWTYLEDHPNRNCLDLLSKLVPGWYAPDSWMPLSSHPIFVKQQPSWGQFWAQTNKTQEQIPNHLGLLFLGVYPMSDIKITKNEDMI